MDLDTDKIDEAVLALLYLTSFVDKPVQRAWKGHDWDALDRLHKKGLIADPKGKVKSVIFTDDGFDASKKLFEQMFTKGSGSE